MWNFKIALPLFTVTLLVLNGCRTRESGNETVALGGYSIPVEGLDDLDRVLARHGFQKSDMSRLDQGSGSESGLSFRSALSLAWLSAVVYGSAEQIVENLAEASFITDADAVTARKQIERVESIRSLASAFQESSRFRIWEFTKEAGAERKKEIGLSALPDLYAFLAKSEDFGRDLDAKLEAELGKDPLVANIFQGDELALVMSFLKGEPIDAQLVGRSLESSRLTIIFDDLVKVIRRSCEDLIGRLAAQDASLLLAVDKVRSNPRYLASQIDHLLLLTAETLDYGMTSAFLSGAAGDSGGLRIFSGGRLSSSYADLFRVGSTQLVVISNPSSSDVFFVFRGTSGIVDLQRDFDPTMSRAPSPLNGQVHGGFWKGLSELIRPKLLGDETGALGPYRPFVEEILAHARRSGKRIWLTGHSLGGGLAILLGSQLLSKSKDGSSVLPMVYTYGAPMVGNEDFVSGLPANFQERVFRFVYQDDLIPRINPLGSLRPDAVSIKFLNEGRQCTWHSPNAGTSAELSGDAGGPELQRCGKGEPLKHGQLGLSKIPSGIKDHDIAAYIESLALFTAPSRP